MTLSRVCLVKSGALERPIWRQQTFGHFVFLSYLAPTAQPAILRFQTQPWERGRYPSRWCVCWLWALWTPPGHAGGFSSPGEERWWGDFLFLTLPSSSSSSLFRCRGCFRCSLMIDKSLLAPDSSSSAPPPRPAAGAPAPPNGQPVESVQGGAD